MYLDRGFMTSSYKAGMQKQASLQDSLFFLMSKQYTKEVSILIW